MTDPYAGIDRNDPAARRRAALADIAEQRAKLPTCDANGYARPYDVQSETYRSVVTRAEHERAHGTGFRPSDHTGRDRARG